MKDKKIEKQIREICTYHSDDGTSGYSLSEEQFEELFALMENSKRKEIETLRHNAKFIMKDVLQELKWRNYGVAKGLLEYGLKEMSHQDGGRGVRE